MIENTTKDPFATTSINYWAIICRRRWWLLLSLVAGSVVAFFVSHVIPPVYTSRAIVLVSHSGVPDNYVELNFKSDLAERMRNISERVFDYTHLEKIIEEFHLYPNLSARKDPEQVVNAMRHDIQIDPLPADDAASPEQAGNEDPAQAARRALVPQNGKTPDSIALRLSYSARDRVVAQQVTSELLSLMIEENMQDRRKQSEITTNFLQSQATQALDQLNLQQARIQEFKTRYMGQTPDDKESNIQALSQLESRLQSANDALDRARQQKIYLNSLYAQYTELQKGLTSDKADPGTPEAAAQQMEKLQKQLDDLEGRYTERYPDIGPLQREINRLKALKAQSTTDADANPKQQPAADPPSSLPHPKTYSEFQALTPILQIKSQLESNESEIENREKEVNDTKSAIANYVKLLDAMPLRDQQLQELTQTYNDLKATYDSLATKASQSNLATDLEKHQQGEQWEILAPPEAPRKPSFPDRFMFSLAGLGVGLVVGIGLVVFKELTDDRIFDEDALKGVGRDNVPVLGKIPPLHTEPEKQLRRRKLALQWAGGTAVIIVVAAITAFSFLRG